MRIRGRYAGDESVTCVIPGHEQAGEEFIADELAVKTVRLTSATPACAATPQPSTARGETAPSVWQTAAVDTEAPLRAGESLAAARLPEIARIAWSTSY